jgi:predicted GIY-YIG superfamily endonuclease
MAWVYILRGSSGRHYIGSAINLDARFAQHLRGHTATTKRLGSKLEIVAKKEVATLGEARNIECFCGSIRSGIKSATILVFRNWP